MDEPTDVHQIVDRWVAAERDGDPGALDLVLHHQFVFAGPYGYLLDKAQWLSRLTPGSRFYAVFDTFSFTADVPTRVIGDTALVVGTQRQTGTAQGERVDGRLRGSIVLVRDPDWLIAGLHLSLAEPPTPS